MIFYELAVCMYFDTIFLQISGYKSDVNPSEMLPQLAVLQLA